MNSFLDLPNVLIVSYIFIVGLCVGSFLNVVILRGLSGESFVFGRSKCPKCSNKLKWYMNIPLLSYIFLRGKCAYCKTPISIQYPIVELIVGLMFLGVFLLFGVCLKTLLLWIIFSLFVALSVTDIKETVIIAPHAYTLFAFSLLYAAFGFGFVNIWQAILGAVLGFVVFEALSRIGLLLVKYRMFGEGDSYIALSLGAIFGIKNLLIVIIMSFLIQCLFAVPILIKNAFKSGKKNLALSYSIIFPSIIIVGFINKLQGAAHLISAVFLTCFLMWSLKNIIDEVKNKTPETFEEAQGYFCLMPFGPALIISATVCIFYLSKIKSLICNFIF